MLQSRKTNEKKASRYLKIVRSVFIVCQRQAITLYSSKYSWKDFTIWQHIAILDMFPEDREITESLVDNWLSVSDEIVDALGLKKEASTLHHILKSFV